jgi:hypothetical protein
MSQAARLPLCVSGLVFDQDVIRGRGRSLRLLAQIPRHLLQLFLLLGRQPLSLRSQELALEFGNLGLSRSQTTLVLLALSFQREAQGGIVPVQLRRLGL